MRFKVNPLHPALEVLVNIKSTKLRSQAEIIGHF